MDPKRRLMISIALGISMSVGVWLYLRQAERNIRSHYVMTTALKTRRFIARGKTITEDLVEETAVPVAYVQPTALASKNELRGADGNYHFKASVGLVKGEQITKSKIYEDTALRGLSWVIPLGQQAFSLRLAPEQAAAGLLLPGDWVDVLATIDRQEGWPQTKTVGLFRRVQILAVEDQIWDPGVSTTEKIHTKSVPNESILVTLALTADESTAAALAVEKGKISLALTSPMETNESRRQEARLPDIAKGL